MWSLHLLSMFRKDNIILYISEANSLLRFPKQCYSLCFVKSLVALCCIYFFSLVNSFMESVCHSVALCISQRETFLFPFIPIFLTVDQTSWFSYCTKAGSFSSAPKNIKKERYYHARLNRVYSLLHRQGRIMSQHSFISITQLHLIFKTLHQNSLALV